MADEIDRADQEVERNLAQAMRLRKRAAPAATGFCLYCGEVVDEERRWCSIDCREDWEKEARRGR